MRLSVRIVALNMLIVLSFGHPHALAFWVHLAVTYLIAVVTNCAHIVVIYSETVTAFMQHNLDAYFIGTHFC